MTTIEETIHDTILALEYIEKMLHDIPDQSLRGAASSIAATCWNIENIRLKLEKALKHD